MNEQLNTQVILEDFEKFYSENILPHLKEAERLRKRILLNYSIIGIVLFVGLCIEAVTWMSIALLVVILFVLFYTKWFGVPAGKYERAFINAITIPAMGFRGRSLMLDNNSYLKLSELKNALFIAGNPDYYSGKNLISGTVKGWEIKISEIKSSSKIKNKKGDLQDHEYFNGLVIISNNKNENNHMICTDHTLSEHYADFNHLIRFNDDETLIEMTDGKNTLPDSVEYAIKEKINNYSTLFKKDIIYSTGNWGNALAIINARGFTYFEPTVLKTALNKKIAENYCRDLWFLIDAINA